MTAAVVVAALSTAIAAAATQPARLSTRAPRRLIRAPLVVVAVALAVVWRIGLEHLAFGAIVAADLGFVLWLVTSSRRRRAASRRSREVLSVCDALAAELRAGLPVGTALQRAAAGWPPLRPVAEAARLGADVPAALRALAREPGLARLVTVAAAWQVSERSGASLAATLRRTADVLRSDLRLVSLVEVELGAARASARLLAALPLFALLLGSGVGIDAFGFFSSAMGLVCFGAGSALLVLGVVWLERLARVEAA